MSSLKTELRLAILFKTIIDGEKQLEAYRQVLAEQPNFDPNFIFNHLDKTSHGFLSMSSISQFLKFHNIDVIEKDIATLFHVYENTRTNQLSYSNFLNIILPRACPSLRQLSVFRDRTKTPKKKKNHVSYETEWALARVIDKEVNFNRKLDLLKQDIVSRGDFASHRLFNTIDVHNLGVLDIDSLYIFMKKNKISVNENDIVVLLRNVDQDNDGKLSYSEFCRMILPATSQTVTRKTRASSTAKKRSSSRSTTPNRNPSKTQRNTEFSFTYTPGRTSHANNMSKTSPIEQTHQRESFQRTSSVESHRRSHNAALYNDLSVTARRERPIEATPSVFAGNSAVSRIVDTSLDSGLKGTKKMPMDDYSYLWERATAKELNVTIPTRSGTGSMRRSEIEKEDIESSFVDEEIARELASVLKQQIDLDKEVENSKNELALQIDFNLMDTFKLFDIESKGLINKYEFGDGLECLQVQISKKELELVLRRFDRDQDGFLRYSDFCSMLTPAQAEYAEILHNRMPFYSKKRGPEKLSMDTTILIRRTLNMIISNESYNECLRQRLNSKPSFSAYKAFKALDKTKNGFIGTEELKNLLNAYGFYISQKELATLTSRFDKNQDGRITYNKFVEEIKPKAM